MCLFERQNDREKEIDLLAICHSSVATQWTVLAHAKKPGTWNSSGLPTWVAVAQIPGLASAAFPGALAGSWRSGAVRTWIGIPVTMWHPTYPHCATMPTPISWCLKQKRLSKHKNNGINDTQKDFIIMSKHIFTLSNTTAYFWNREN